MAKFTVYYVVNRFKELGTSEERPGSGKLCIARTKKVIKAARERGKEESEEFCKTNS